MRTAVTTLDLIQQMAFNSGREIEMTSEAAFLTVGQTTWYALLEPVGRAS